MNSTSWTLLMQSEVHEKRKTVAAASCDDDDDADDSAFFLPAMPLTTGPGSISDAVALSQRPTGGTEMLAFFGGASAAALCIAAIVWVCYRSSDRVTDLLGPHGARVVSTVIASILLCVGVQIIVTRVMGVADIYAVRR